MLKINALLILYLAYFLYHFFNTILKCLFKKKKNQFSDDLFFYNGSFVCFCDRVVMLLEEAIDLFFFDLFVSVIVIFTPQNNAAPVAIRTTATAC